MLAIPRPIRGSPPSCVSAELDEPCVVNARVQQPEIPGCGRNLEGPFRTPEVLSLNRERDAAGGIVANPCQNWPRTRNARRPKSRCRASTGVSVRFVENEEAPRRQLSSKQLSNTRFPQHVYWQQLTDFASRSVAQIRRQLRRNRRLVCVADGPGWPRTSWCNGGADRTTVTRSAVVGSDVAGRSLCIPLVRSGSLLRCLQGGAPP